MKILLIIGLITLNVTSACADIIDTSRCGRLRDGEQVQRCLDEAERRDRQREQEERRHQEHMTVLRDQHSGSQFSY
jgi:hypothetical protein